MILSAVRAWIAIAIVAAAPLLVIPVSFLVFYFQRAIWRQSNCQRGPNSGFSPSTFTLGIALQHLDRFTHPSVEYIIQETYEEDADEDGQHDLDDPKLQMKRQLRRVRLGESVDRLILRLR